MALDRYVKASIDLWKVHQISHCAVTARKCAPKQRAALLYNSAHGVSTVKLTGMKRARSAKGFKSDSDPHMFSLKKG